MHNLSDSLRFNVREVNYYYHSLIQKVSFQHFSVSHQLHGSRKNVKTNDKFRSLLIWLTINAALQMDYLRMQEIVSLIISFNFRLLSTYIVWLNG